MNLKMERREKSFSFFLIFFVFLLFFIFFILQVLGPIFLPKASITDLSGSTAIFDNEFEISNMPQPWNFIYSIGDRMCHQKSERSFFINNNQMPFCSRCTGIWAGIAFGLGFILFFKINLDKRFFYLLIISVIPIGVDGIGQLLGFWQSTNIIRLSTGLFIGFIAGISIGIIIDEFTDILSKYKKN